VVSTRTQPAVGSGLRIEIERKVFESPPTVALEGLAFTVEPGEFVAIVGPSGAGKSTLLNIVAGLDRRYEGEVAPAAGEDGAQVRRVSYVFQTPRLMPWLTALENVRLVLPHETGDKGGDKTGDKGGDIEAAREILEAVGLRGFEDAYPGQLSGGMQRRVALARAFSVNPALLLMDEPFASLDDPLAWRLRGRLHELWCRRRSTVLFVTHDLKEALSLADRVLFLSPRPGRIVWEQPVELPHPRSHDDRGVERLRADLLARHPELLAGRAGEVPGAGGEGAATPAHGASRA
jgi:ABC-type nitrate/sulfonate/bicarbonate transport system ATPase subunit